MIASVVHKPDTFLFFTYGPNILSFRMHMHSSSAEFVSIGRANDYALDFIKYHKFWQGPEATIVPTANAHTWGVIWRIESDKLVSLNDAKGINHKKYYVRYIDILTPYMGIFKCRTYIQRVNPLPRGANDPIPVERWPSWTYRMAMIMGAKEHDFPPYYIEYLENMKDNGQEGCLRVYCLCERYGRDEPCECLVPGRIPRRPLKLDVRVVRYREIHKHGQIQSQVPKRGTARARARGRGRPRPQPKPETQPETNQ